MTEGSPADQLRHIITKALTATKPIKEDDASSAYRQKPSLENAFRLGGQSAIAGLLLTGLRNALAGRNTGFLTTMGVFAAVGGTFAMTESVVANQRQTDDALNGAAGACAAGFLLGLRVRSLPLAVGSCSIMGGMMGLYDYSSGSRRPASAAQSTFFKPTAVVEAGKS
ncbi:hypothetical protein DFH09DRAFT_1354317 [Mycena vulgaris]|nr:hypothetical protein DFH09DRAFT_1354317 [Mycena vulgaris]